MRAPRIEDVAIVTLVALFVVTLLFAAVGCTPAQVAWFRHEATPAQQRAVVAALSAQRPSTDCYGALHHFPGDRATARQIIHRESRNNPRAQNPRSTAAGCFQLLRMHAWRFDAVGCSWAQRYQPVCNVKAAAHLYRAAGWSPWRA